VKLKGTRARRVRVWFIACKRGRVGRRVRVQDRAAGHGIALVVVD
jgi:hypothetical protein